MLRLYFDTNVFKEFAKSYRGLSNQVLQNVEDERIMIFYSFAHIQDLSRDKTDHKNKDLVDMQKFVHDNFLKYDYAKQRLDYLLAFPEESYNAFHKEADYGDVFNFKEIQPTGYKDLDNLAESVTDTINKMRMPLNLGLDQVPDPDKIEKLYKSIGIEEGNYLMSDMYSIMDTLFKSLFNSPKFGRDLRRTGIEMYDYNKLSNATTISEIDLCLKDTGLNMSLFEMVEKTGDIMEKSKLPWGAFEEWKFIYTCLGFMLPNDEKNKTYAYANGASDADHAYYSTLCDYLVTNDKGLLKKSKLMYNHNDCITKAVNINELESLIYEYQDTFNSNLKQSVLEVKKQHIDSKKGTNIELEYPLYGYFNSAKMITNEDNTQSTFFYRSRMTHGITYTYKEIKANVNHMVTTFGNDFHRKKKFTAQDLDDIQNKKWGGRNWMTSDYYILLNIEQSQNIFYLIVKEK